jgi:CheY-like chemotaxis protein
MQALAGWRILLVGRDTQARYALSRILREHKAVVVHAQDALEALFEYEQQPFNIVFADYHLPDMEGDELAETIKACHPNQRVILLAERIDQVLVEGAAPLSADLVLSTPCSMPQLGLALRYPAPVASLLAVQ